MMKNVMMCMGIVTILMVLALNPAMAVESKDKTTACTDGTYYTGYTGYIRCPDSSGQAQTSGFTGYDWSQYPGSTVICWRWIPPHWVPVRTTVPGRWISRPMWIPSQQVTRYRWQEGSWQTTGTNMRPDVFRWGTSQRPGVPTQTGQTGQTSFSGYFNAYGMWIPQR